MATEYISREAVLALKNPIGAYGMDIESKAVEQIPAADVRPVVHGGWKPNPRNPYWLNCTVCGYGKPERTVYSFCPNCGADMREVQSNG